MATTREMTVGEKIVYDLQSGDHGVVFRSTRAFKSSFDIGKSLADAIDEALREREQDITDCVHAAVTYYCGGPKLRAMTPRETADWIIKRAGLSAIRRNEEEGEGKDGPQ